MYKLLSFTTSAAGTGCSGISLGLSVWPTPEVQTNDITGFLDPENMGLGTEITFLSVLVSEL